MFDGLGQKSRLPNTSSESFVGRLMISRNHRISSTRNVPLQIVEHHLIEMGARLFTLKLDDTIIFGLLASSARLPSAFRAPLTMIRPELS